MNFWDRLETSFDQVGSIVTLKNRVDVLEEENKILTRRVLNLEQKQQQSGPECPPTDEELKK